MDTDSFTAGSPSAARTAASEKVAVAIINTTRSEHRSHSSPSTMMPCVAPICGSQLLVFGRCSRAESCSLNLDGPDTSGTSPVHQ